MTNQDPTNHSERSACHVVVPTMLRRVKDVGNADNARANVVELRKK